MFLKGEVRTPGQDDSKQFEIVKEAMETVGFSSSEKDEIFEIVAAILHLGQVIFKQEGNYGKVLSHDVVKVAAQVSLFSSSFTQLAQVLVYTSLSSLSYAELKSSKAMVMGNKSIVGRLA
jgi:myosin heavy subunit